MAVAAIANHGERHVNPLIEQRQEKQSATNTSAREGSANNAVTEDTFTPSDQNNSVQATAQAAGIFQVSQAPPIATAVLAQAPINAEPNAAAPQAAPATTTNSGDPQTPAAANNNTPANAPQQANAIPPAQAVTAAGAATTDVQSQIQSLNTTLAALGLNHYDIEQIDRIATVIQNFNPSAYTDLVNQFQQLAQQTGQQSTLTAAANTSVAANLTTAAGNNANVNKGGFQIQSVSINFTGAQGTANSTAPSNGSQGAGANNAQNAADNLQIEQVQITLTNGTGQAVQIQAPQQSTNTGTPSLQAAQNHVATA